MNHRLSDQTYYEILEVASDASPQEIHAAYHRARTTYSPNSPALYSMFTREEALELMSLIEEAFAVLSHQNKRKDYDKQLIRQATAAKPTPMTAARLSPEFPDFQPPDHQAIEETNRKKNSEIKNNKHEIEMVAPPQKPKRDIVPEGFGKTRFSVYQIDPNFENELQQTRVFDGSFLQRVRVYKQISVDQLSQETRISRTYLTALESNDYLALPAPVFTRGFIIQIARLLGLNEKLAADSYMSLYRHAKK